MPGLSKRIFKTGTSVHRGSLSPESTEISGYPFFRGALAALTIAASVVLSGNAVWCETPFPYDGAATLRFRSAPDADGARDVAVVDSAGRPLLSGIFVQSASGARHGPAIIWVHWLGTAATSNHTEFESDAKTLAKSGATSLLLDMPWSDPAWFEHGRSPATDAAEIERDVSALRSAVGALVRALNVDATRIAYVGHDFGAMEGALLLGADDRIGYAVLMAPTLSFWEWTLLGAPPADASAYLDRMSQFDLPRWLPRGHQRATLLQFADDDEYVARRTATVIGAAVPSSGRTFKRYAGDHALSSRAIGDDRRRWLIEQLGLEATRPAHP